jgi:hypothetical protein
MRFCNKLLSSIVSQKHMSLYKHVAVMFYSTCSRGLHSKALQICNTRKMEKLQGKLAFVVVVIHFH